MVDMKKVLFLLGLMIIMLLTLMASQYLCDCHAGIRAATRMLPMASVETSSSSVKPVELI